MNLKISLKSKVPNWQRSKIAPTIIKRVVIKSNLKLARKQGFLGVKISKELNQKIWSRGCKKPGKYIKVSTEFDSISKIIIIKPYEPI
jgi:ribosomal protein L31E